MADNSNKQLLVVLDKYVDRASELVVVTTKTKNRNSVEATSADTMDMKTFISRSFSTKMYVNIFDAATEEWLWKTNPKVTHIHERCVELWGQDEVEKEELEEDELETEESVEEEPESEDTAEEAYSDDSEPAEESVEEEELESEDTAEEADSDESEPTEESKQDLFAAARAAVANRKAKDSTTSKPSTKKANSSKPSVKKIDKSSKKATELEEDLDEEEELEDDEPKKSGFIIWVLAIIATAVMSIAIYLTLKPGREMETLGLTAQYTEATHRLNREVEPAWYRWESWDRSVAAEATLTWGPYFRALYVEGEGKNPTPNSIQLYAVYLTMKVLVQQGHEPGEALRIIREEGSKSVVSALNKGSISSEDIDFIREYMMK
jgi:hypothetical protein